MRPSYLFALLIFVCCHALAQAQSLLRQRSMVLLADTVQVDTLSLVPSSLILRDSAGKIIPNDQYRVDYPRAQMVVAAGLRGQNVMATYRGYPFYLAKIYVHKEQHLWLSSDTILNARPGLYAPQAFAPAQGLLSGTGLEHSGNISRGINVSNAGGNALNSEMNLQLSGQLTENIRLLASISDKNLPALPEGNTASLQEFDRIFIQLSTEQSSLQAGDVELTGNTGMFERYQRKALGSQFSTQQRVGNTTSTQNSAAAGIAKGKFTRQTLVVIDGNQGPYRLRGEEGEGNVALISGSDRVYVNGVPATRGADADYVINYATAEIVFTAKQVVRYDMRIVVEFEYTERSYTRYVLTSKNAMGFKRGNAHVNVFFETDDKNQPVDAAQSDAAKQAMANVGGNTDAAYLPTADSGLQLLTTPKQALFVAAGGAFCPDSLSKMEAEIALAHHNVNLFADKSQAQTTGVATHVLANKTLNLGLHQVFAQAKTMLYQADFEGIDPFLAPEFERDWNIEGTAQHRALQHYEAATAYRFAEHVEVTNSVGFLQLGQGGIHAWDADSVLAPTLFAAMQGVNTGMGVAYKAGGFASAANARYLTTTERGRNTAFARGDVLLSQKIARVTVGARGEFEHNVDITAQQWQGLSRAFHQQEVFVNTQTTAIKNIELSAKLRNDFLPRQNEWNPYLQSKELGLNTQFALGRHFEFDLTNTYRNVRHLDSSALAPQHLLLARERISGNFARGAVQTAATYELGAGMEPKQNYVYVEVGAGFGVYAWRDYNQNGEKEPNEFEIAAFKDEANYIRIALPSREYVQTYSGAYSFQISLQPAQYYGGQRTISRWSNTLLVSNAQKNLQQNFAKTANPFARYTDNDTSLVSILFSAHNRLSYLSRNARWRMAFVWQKTHGKNYLIYGFEESKTQSWGYQITYGAWSNLPITAGADCGTKSLNSAYVFSEKNYNLVQISPQLGVEYTPVQHLRLNATYNFADKKNTAGSERALVHSLTTECSYNMAQKGVATLNAGYVSTRYNTEDVYSAVAYELLQGFGVGNNFTWGATFNRTLGGGLEVNVLYAARRPSQGSIIHSGNVELRLNF